MPEIFFNCFYLQSNKTASKVSKDSKCIHWKLWKLWKNFIPFIPVNCFYLENKSASPQVNKSASQIHILVGADFKPARCYRLCRRVPELCGKLASRISNLAAYFHPSLCAERRMRVCFLLLLILSILSNSVLLFA